MGFSLKLYYHPKSPGVEPTIKMIQTLLTMYQLSKFYIDVVLVLSKFYIAFVLVEQILGLV